ncbi:MAG: hypothetical protein AAGI07_18155 [Bacteroidota bacterium]
MKRKIVHTLFILLSTVMLSSCFGDHNKAVVEGVNKDSQRIYGDRGGEPRQLLAPYEEDETGEVADRIQNIKDKFFPE